MRKKEKRRKFIKSITNKMTTKKYIEEGKASDEIPVTTDIPMLRDKRVYKLFLIRKDEKINITEIKVISKICNVNYIEARKKLKEASIFIAEGNAYQMKDFLKILSRYEVSYQIKPPYEYMADRLSIKSKL